MSIPKTTSKLRTIIDVSETTENYTKSTCTYMMTSNYGIYWCVRDDEKLITLRMPTRQHEHNAGHDCGARALSVIVKFELNKDLRMKTHIRSHRTGASWQQPS